MIKINDKKDILKALEDIRMGRVISDNMVHAWLKSWGTKNERHNYRKIYQYFSNMAWRRK